MTTPQTILVTGSTGLIGTALVQSLETAGHQVIRAVRRPVKDPKKETQWDPANGKIDRDRLEGLDAVVHLAGANIAGKRWTAAYKQKLIDSRTQGTTLLSDTLAKLDRKPKVFASASAIGFYGNRGEEQLDESSPSGNGFLPEICLQWERSCQAARDAGIRVANLRLGVVLSPASGALSSMLTPFKLGLGGILGNGRQHFSWIALPDAIQAIQFILANDTLSGPINLVTPNPVTNREFTKTLGGILSRPTVFPLPAFAARLIFGEMADALFLDSTRVTPQVLAQAGFNFQHPTLEPALRHLLHK